MPTINELTEKTTLSSGDQFPIYSPENGTTRKVSASTILAYIQENDETLNGGDFTTQYAAPSATGFSVLITDGSADIWLILTPVAGYAAGTIVLPTSTNLVDKQEILVNCTQSVTTLTISLNGATAVTGAPTTLAANAFFKLKYDAATSTWYRVG
jgi:hypothetical protein